MCAYAQERTRTKSHSLCLFKQSQRLWKRRCSPIQHTCPQAYLCWQTHTLWDSPTSQRGLVRCQIGNWQTGKSQIILSQLDRDGLNVKMLLGSLRPPELWTGAKTYSPALCCSAMWEDEVAETHRGRRAASCLKSLQSSMQISRFLLVWHHVREFTAAALYNIQPL